MSIVFVCGALSRMHMYVICKLFKYSTYDVFETCIPQFVPQRCKQYAEERRFPFLRSAYVTQTLWVGANRVLFYAIRKGCVRTILPTRDLPGHRTSQVKCLHGLQLRHRRELPASALTGTIRRVMQHAFVSEHIFPYR